MIKRILILALVLISTESYAADKYIFDPAHTNLVWHANHFGYSNPNGQFTQVDGFVVLDNEKPENSKVEATIKITSLWTSTEKFTEHLKSKDFFNADLYPEAKFVSTKVVKTGDKTAEVTGNLTLAGVTKEAKLNIKLNQIGKNPISQKRVAGFSGTASINRSDFGIIYAIPGVSDKVDLAIEIEAILEEDNHDQPAK